MTFDPLPGASHWNTMTPLQRDQFIGEHIMNWYVDDIVWDSEFSPTTDLNSTWRVVRKLYHDERLSLRIRIDDASVDGELAPVITAWFHDPESGVEYPSVTREFAPEAICLAACKALEVEV